MKIADIFIGDLIQAELLDAITITMMSASSNWLHFVVLE